MGVKRVRGSKSLDVKESIVGTRKRKQRSDASFDPVVALKYRKSGMTWEEVAKAVTPEGRKTLSHVAVSKAVKKIMTQEEIDRFTSRGTVKRIERENIADILEEKHRTALEAITPEKLEDASVRDNAMVSKLLYEQLRLENNKSTKNVAMTFAQVVEGSVGEDGL